MIKSLNQNHTFTENASLKYMKSWFMRVITRYWEVE